MNANKTKTLKERGISLIFTAMTLVFIVPMVGLAIDAGILYTVKGKLQMAVDAASLAAARALSRGNDDTTQQNNAKAVAQEYVLVNFPSGYFNVATPTFGPNNSGISVDESVANQRSVSVTAYVNAPLYFLRWLGSTNTTVSATATAVRRDVNVSVVLDRSGSLQNTGSCGLVKNAAIAFVNKFANLRDNVGLVTFASTSIADFPIANNFQTSTNPQPVTTILGELVCNGGTSSAMGLNLGYQQLVTLNQPNALNVLLFFTDGQPTAFTGTFPIQAGSTCTTKSPKTAVLTVGGTTPWGLMNLTNPGQPLASDLPLLNQPASSISQGCAYAANWMGNPNNSAYQVGNDITNIPTTDVYGNNMNTGYQAVTTSGGYMVLNGANIVNASVNAADSQALKIRQSTAIPNIRIFSIGLGNDPNNHVQTDFLARSANDPRASNFDSNYPTGEYIFAPQAADISDAFAQVASEILHLAR
jgi:Flp pilus assembly protein TadG